MSPERTTLPSVFLELCRKLGVLEMTQVHEGCEKNRSSVLLCLLHPPLTWVSLSWCPKPWVFFNLSPCFLDSDFGSRNIHHTFYSDELMHHVVVELGRISFFGDVVNVLLSFCPRFLRFCWRSALQVSQSTAVGPYGRWNPLDMFTVIFQCYCVFVFDVFHFLVCVRRRVRNRVRCAKKEK